MKAMTIQIRNSDLELVRQALETQIRLTNSYVNKTQEQQLRLIEFQDLHSKVNRIIETRPD